MNCQIGNIKTFPFPIAADTTNRATRCLERIHVDIAGPVEVPSMGGSRYVLFIRDDWSRFADAILLDAKSDAPDGLQGWIVRHESRLRLKLLYLRSDSGGEFISANFEAWLYDRGITHERTVR
jgi:transposase InsO family protein